MKFRNTAGLLIATSALTLAACGGTAAGGGASPAPAASPATTIMVVSDPATIGTYTPPEATAHVGETVEWVFADQNPHTATADDGGFDSTTLAAGKTYSHRFDSAGTFKYHCAIHPEMHGTLVVS